MKIEKKCPLCNNQSASIREYEDLLLVNCDDCGIFSISFDLIFPQELVDQKGITEIEKGLIAGYLFETKAAIHRTAPLYPYEINRTRVDAILSDPLTPKSITDRVDKLLRYIESMTKTFGDSVTIPLHAGYTIYEAELCYMLESLVAKKYLDKLCYTEGSSGNIIYQAILTLQGMEYLKSLRKHVKNDQCFIAMWFSEETNDLWEKAIRPGSLDAGYNPIRIDKHQHNNNIVDEILAEIRNSNFLVADFTGQNRGVYYEAGFAKGLGKEVIQLCRKDHFEKKVDIITNKPVSEFFMHFDNSQINTLIWEKGKEEDVREPIRFRIESIFGHGSFQND